MPPIDATLRTASFADRIHALTVALRPLACVADRYDQNDLEAARKTWGLNNEHENKTPPGQIVLVDSRGGGTIVSLADAIRARDVLRAIGDRT